MGVSTAGTSMYEQLRELVRAVERGEFQLLNLSITQNESRRALQRGIGDDYDRQYSIGTSATIHVDIEVAPGKIGIVGERGSVGAPGGRGGSNSGGGNSSAVFVSGGGGGSGGAGVSASEWQDYTTRRDVEETQARDRVRYATSPGESPNPWMPENWSVTAQGAYVTKYGVEKAAAAARAADSRVGSTSPGEPWAEITRTTDVYPRRVRISPTDTFIQRLSAQLASMRDVDVVRITQRGYDLLRVGGVLSGDMSPVTICGVNLDIIGTDNKKAPWPTEAEREVARDAVATEAEVVRSLKNGAREIDFD